MSRNWSWAVASLAAVVATACGTTVSTTTAGSTVTNAQSELGLGSPSTGSISTLPGASEPTGSTGATSATTTGGGQATLHPRRVASSPRQGKVVVPPAHRAALAPVEVGIVYEPDVQQFGSALGGNLDTGDEKLEAQAVVNWINAHGGFAGHLVKPVFTAVKLTSTAPYDQMAAEVCASWTQDHHVVAGIFIASNVPTSLAQCLNSHRVFYFENGFYLHDEQDFAQLPYMVDSAELEGDAGARTYVDSLWRNGFFAKGDKLGAIVMDYDAAKRVYAHALVPQLAAHGLAAPIAYFIHNPTSTPDISNSVTDVQSAELRMRASGVTKVLFLCYGCADFFMQDAESQHWNPKYGLSTYDSPWYLASQAPADQLAGAQAVGWMPLNDTPVQFAPTNPTVNLCADILRPSAQATRQQPKYVAYEYCDAFLTMQAAAQHSSAVSGTGLVQGLGGLGSGYQSPIGLHTELGADKHWGVDAVQPMRFESGCTCFKYSGRAEPITR